MNKKLRAQLLKMFKKDQQVRAKQHKNYLVLIKKKQEMGEKKFSYAIKKLAVELQKLDRIHTNIMKKIIRKLGWPNNQLVGRRGSYTAWLLVQHADHDLSFQKKCLALLEKAAKNGLAEKKNIAYLTDRILIHEKRPQLYGTQFTRTDRKYIPFPITNKKNLANRRKEMGLESMRECSKKINAFYNN